MVRKRRIKAKSTSLVLESGTDISKLGKGGLMCIGEVCFTDDGYIKIDLSKSKCSPKMIDKLVKRVMKGAKTKYVLEKSESKDKEESKEVKNED